MKMFYIIGFIVLSNLSQPVFAQPKEYIDVLPVCDEKLEGRKIIQATAEDVYVLVCRAGQWHVLPQNGKK